MISAEVPWIGALIAARSDPAHSLGLREEIRGNQVLRPNSVSDYPFSRTLSSVWTMYFWMPGKRWK